ncbi:hypothetical protein ACFQ23_02165 [Schaalia naturae]|uniref:Nucleic acid-binding protein n=1 Tax=Schaalia naturae TaxID=635203 RepID=A0ABW2SIC2_9ACTO
MEVRILTSDGSILCFDTGPLRHFAVEGWLGVLKYLTRDRQVWIPDTVHEEITFQSSETPSLVQVLDAQWIRVDHGGDLEYAMAFARYKDRLASGRTNLGECGVLALGDTLGAEVVLDDRIARQIAEEEGIHVISTLTLLCDGIRQGKLTVGMVEQVADDLIAGDYYLPFGRGGFRYWALEQAMIGWEDR